MNLKGIRWIEEADRIWPAVSTLGVILPNENRCFNWMACQMANPARHCEKGPAKGGQKRTPNRPFRSPGLRQGVRVSQQHDPSVRESSAWLTARCGGLLPCRSGTATVGAGRQMTSDWTLGTGENLVPACHRCAGSHQYRLASLGFRSFSVKRVMAKCSVKSRRTIDRRRSRSL